MAGPFSRFTATFFYAVIVIGLGAALLEALLIVVLLTERSRRRRVQHALAERLRLEAVLAELSIRLATLSAEQIDDGIIAALRRLGEVLGVDRAGLWRSAPDGSELRLTHGWHASNVPPTAPVLAAAQLPVRLAEMQRGEIVQMTLPGEDPAGERPGPSRAEPPKVVSMVALALSVGGTAWGLLGFSSEHGQREWTDEVLHGLRAAGEIFSIALQRKESGLALARSEALGRAALSSLPGAVAVLDRQGVILRINRGWTATGGPFGGLHEGANYLERLRAGGTAVAGGEGDSAGRDRGALLTLVADVLAGRRGAGLVECHSLFVPGWLEIRVEPLERSEGGAVVSHVDVTARKRAELEARHARDQFAHVGHAAALGELAAAIAHELNQPLAAILLNAQTAMKLLDRAVPDLAEARESLRDVVADDQRARDVLERIRWLLRQDEARRATQDLSGLVGEVVHLVHSEVERRGVTLAFTPAEASIQVHGDGVQLQQVVLNLLSNAIDAVSGRPAGERRVWIRVVGRGDDAELVVEDNGHGIPEGTLDTIFDPFYTTREEGMGIGLSISRSIVETHDGRLIAEHRPGGGAIFRCVLPRLAEARFAGP
ncbi:MAG TPA: ATP-binding protein [Polyangia bacterium]|jgi:signal transduction histidine kinase|nr:ATP-binding protein [Polyangia bacterium]